MKKALILLITGLLLSGCQLMQRPDTPLLTDECHPFSVALGKSIQQETHFDPAVTPFHHQQPFYLYYRKDRFLDSFSLAELSQAERAAWYEAMRHLGTDTLLTEAARLPSEQRSVLLTYLTGIPDRKITSLSEAIDYCSGRFAELAVTGFPSMDYQVPDSYSTAQRVFGIYPLLSWLAQGSIEDYRQMMTEKVKGGRQQQFSRSTRYVYHPPQQTPSTTSDAASSPAPSLDTLSFDVIARWLAQARLSHPLAVPVLPDQQLEKLFQAFAPGLQTEYGSDADLVGRVELKESRKAQREPVINHEQPVLYYYPSYTRFADQVLLQLNYGFWFAGRPPQSGFDIYAGPLDGILWRVTLDAEGRPLVYDSIHQCGCYHKVYLPDGITADMSAVEGEKPLAFAAGFALQKPGGVTLKIESVTHYIVDVSTDGAGAASRVQHPDAVRYELVPYQALLTLAADEHRRSLFGESGIVEHSSRTERWFLWPLGVPNAGAMRQRGLHAIAFIGKRHFDDPLLWQNLGIQTSAHAE